MSLKTGRVESFDYRAAAQGATGRNPFGFFLNTFVKRLGGDRPLGDITPGGKPIFGDFVREVLAAPRPPDRRAATPPLVPLPAPPPAPLPTGGDILDDLLRRPRAPAPAPPSDLERLLKRGPQSDLERLLDRTFRPGGAATPADIPKPKAPSRLPAVLGRVGGIIGGILYPSDLGDSDLYPPGTAVPAPAPPPPEPPRVTVPEAPPPRPVDTLPDPTPKPEDEFPRPEAPTRSPPDLFPVLLPIPDAPARPEPRPDPTPTATTAPSPAAVPFGFPSLSAFPFQLPSVRTSPTSRITNPEFAAIPGFAAFTAPAPRGLTAAQTSPLGSRSPPNDSNRCRCPPKQRKPKKQRTECFEGFYREKQKGIQKTPRRKVPCQ